MTIRVIIINTDKERSINLTFQNELGVASRSALIPPGRHTEEDVFDIQSILIEEI